MSEMTRLLSQLKSSDQVASDDLLPLVYDELRKLAAAKLARELPGQTLQPTALVHEAYMRLVGEDQSERSWDNRGHFFAAAAEAMRRILVERARLRLSKKRGVQRVRLDMDMAEIMAEESPVEIVALHEALQDLEQHDVIAAQIVKLRFFAGLSLPQVATSLGLALRTVERNWTYARTWLRGELDGELDKNTEPTGG